MKKETFDIIIRENLEKMTSSEFDYIINEQKGKYINYYSKNDFDNFKKEMETTYSESFHSYNKGKGSELKGESKPPKMASVASSSRFCYLALRDGAVSLGLNGKVKFEKSCRISEIKGNSPQLDAFFEDNNTFFEVKCHEIFDKHTVKMKSQYKSAVTNDFGIDVRDDEEFIIDLSEFGIDKSYSMMDIKQLLCHLMGIKSESNGKKAVLYYMFFKPVCYNTEKADEIEKIFSCLKNEIETIFNSTPISSFCKKNNIELKAIALESEIMQSIDKSEIVKLF